MKRQKTKEKQTKEKQIAEKQKIEEQGKMKAGQETAGVPEPVSADKIKKDRQTILKNACCMLFVFLATTAAAAIGGWYFHLDLYYMVRNLFLCMTAALVVIFSYQAGRISGSFSYDDGEHPGRFLFLYLCGILCAGIFINLPVTGWMFLFFYISLARVSDGVTGMCAGTGLLVLATVLCQQISLSSFLVYFFSGMAGIALFAHQTEEFHIAIPLGLSLGIQLVLIFSDELLIQNKKLVPESALIPLANTAVNGILLFIFLLLYVNKVARKIQNLYRKVNDPDYAAMAVLREKSEESYCHAIHTAYLTEHITEKMGLDVMAAKCAACYNHLDKEEQEKYPFPDHAVSLLYQLREKGTALKEKEAVVVMICDEIVTMLQCLKKKEKISGKETETGPEMETESKTGGNKKAGTDKDKGKRIDYVKFIKNCFEKRFTIEAFADTDITLSNLRYIRNRLIKEKMYYETMIK